MEPSREDKIRSIKEQMKAKVDEFCKSCEKIEMKIFDSYTEEEKQLDAQMEPQLQKEEAERSAKVCISYYDTLISSVAVDVNAFKIHFHKNFLEYVHFDIITTVNMKLKSISIVSTDFERNTWEDDKKRRLAHLNWKDHFIAIYIPIVSFFYISGPFALLPDRNVNPDEALRQERYKRIENDIARRRALPENEHRRPHYDEFQKVVGK